MPAESSPRSPAAPRASQPPLAARLVAFYLLLHPIFEALAVWSGQRMLNLQADQRRGWIIYGLAAPFVGWLVWRCHPRARFALYIFMTLEAWRAFDQSPWTLARPLALAIAIAIVLIFQAPAMRRAYPSIERDRYKRLFR